MHIIMTVNTIAKRNPGKYLEFLAVSHFFLMAFNTVHLLVFPDQRIVGIVVIKESGWSKFFG